MNIKELFKAATEKRIAEYRKEIAADPQLLTSRNQSHLPLLHVLAATDQLGVVAKWITGPMLEATADRSWTVVHVAAAAGTMVSLHKVLAKNRYLLCWEDDSGNTPVHVALRHGHGGQIPGLTPAGLAHRNHLGQTPTHVAASNKTLNQIAGYLTAEVLAMKDALNVTALDLAKDTGCLDQLPEQLIKDATALASRTKII